MFTKEELLIIQYLVRKDMEHCSQMTGESMKINDVENVNYWNDEFYRDVSIYDKCQKLWCELN